MYIINVEFSALVSVTDGYIKLTLLLVTIIFFIILYLRKVLLVYSNK